VTIVNPNGNEHAACKTVQIRSYPVNVIFNLGMVEFDSFYIYIADEGRESYFKLYQDVLKPGVAPPGPDATDEQINAATIASTQATSGRGVIDNPDNVADMRDRIQKRSTGRCCSTTGSSATRHFFRRCRSSGGDVRDPVDDPCRRGVSTSFPA